MRKTGRALALILAVALLASPIAAQGKGRGAGGGKANDIKAQPGAPHAQPSHAQAPAKAKEHSATQSPGKPAKNADAGRGSDHKGQADKLTGREKAEARKEVQHEAGGEVKRANPFSAEPGRARSRFVREIEFRDLTPSARRFVISDRPEERLVGKAVAQANARGIAENALLIVPVGTHLIVRNLSGITLLDLADDRARSLGSWRAVTIDDRVKDGAPSFCRSGAGHPKWGRQWCLDKGFGLGTENDSRWSRVIDPDRIVFREVARTPTLSSDMLRAVIGDVALDRLALHALTLGLVDPLTGNWMGEPTGPRVLLLTSGRRPVAELVDANRDNLVDNLLVALRPW